MRAGSGIINAHNNSMPVDNLVGKLCTVIDRGQTWTTNEDEVKALGVFGDEEWLKGDDFLPRIGDVGIVQARIAKWPVLFPPGTYSALRS